MQLLAVFSAVTVLSAVHGAPSQSSGLKQSRNWFWSMDPYTDVTFHLFTRKNRASAHQIWIGNISNSAYDPAKPTKFTVHGYNDNGFTWWTVKSRDSFLYEEDCNVILVDWTEPADGPLYNFAKSNAITTGHYVGDMYKYLISLGQKAEDIHCVGHSLGAHVCGFSGKRANGAIGRITGIEPAHILFFYSDPEGRLTYTDAAFVDVIHTCGSWMSFSTAIGHADFYPNGGDGSQPGCGFDLFNSCCHGRAADLFHESIESKNFVAYQCESWEDFEDGKCNTNKVALMGYPSSPDTRGKFYLYTAGDYPYAEGYPVYC